MVEDENRTTEDAGLCAVADRSDLKLSGGKRRCVAVDGLPKPGEEEFVRLGHVAADDQDLGIEEIDRAGNDVADQSAAASDEPAGFAVAVQGEADDITHVTDASA